MDTFGQNYAKELAQEILDHHPEAGLPQDFRLPNFAPLGDTLEVEALIGLADFAIFPKIVFETSLGVNIYKVPIQAAQGQPRFCFGGNINQLTSDAMGGSRKEENKRRRHMAHFFSFLSKHSWPKRISFPWP